MSYALIGFVLGFIVGMIVNMILLRGVDRAKMRNDKNMRLKYGGLNWGIALAGMAIGIALERL